jgi:hypothetical protein
MKVLKSRNGVLGAAILILGMNSNIGAIPSQDTYQATHPSNLAYDDAVVRAGAAQPRPNQQFLAQAKFQEPQYRWFCYIMGGRRKCFYF